MSRLFQEAFSAKLTPAQLGQTLKWDYVGSGIVSVAGRTNEGISGTLGASEADNMLRSRALAPSTPDTGYHGLAVKCLSLPAVEQKLWTLLDESGTVQVTLTITPTATCRVYLGTLETGTLLGTSPLAMFTSAFRYLEIGHTLTGSGRIEVRSIPASGTARVFVVVGGVSAMAWSRFALYLTDQIVVDDSYVNDGIATPGPNYFSGDTAIEVLDPEEVTFLLAYFPWTANSGSDRVVPVADAAMDGDASYLYTRQSYSWIQYRMAALVDDGRRVDDVQFVAVARVVSSAFTPLMDFSWTRYDGVALFTALIPAGVTQTDYTAFVGLTRAGLGGNDWTIARVNATRFGVRS